MRILGLDISTFTGICFTEDGIELPFTEVINFPKLSGYPRLWEIAHAVMKHVDLMAPDFVVIEGYNYNAKFQIVGMVEVGTVIRMGIYERGIPFYDVSPSSVKKFAGVPGNAKKPIVAAGVKAMWGFSNPSDDIVDAYILNRIGQAIAILGRVPTSLVKGIKYEGSRVP